VARDRRSLASTARHDDERASPLIGCGPARTPQPPGSTSPRQCAGAFSCWPSRHLLEQVRPRSPRTGQGIPEAERKDLGSTRRRSAQTQPDRPACAWSYGSPRQGTNESPAITVDLPASNTMGR
jgi:hypothetical protein